MNKVSFRKIDVDGLNIFYREAGPKDAPTILLLHGFPSAGHMFRDLIPLLANRFHVIARRRNRREDPRLPHPLDRS